MCRKRPPALGLPGGACRLRAVPSLFDISHCRVGAGRAGTPSGRVTVSLSAAKQDILPDGPWAGTRTSGAEDTGGVRHRYQSHPDAACSDAQPARCGAMPWHSLPLLTLSRSPAGHSQGGRRLRNLAAFLFKKEEKNTQPHKEQNQ